MCHEFFSADIGIQQCCQHIVWNVINFIYWSVEKHSFFFLGTASLHFSILPRTRKLSSSFLMQWNLLIQTTFLWVTIFSPFLHNEILKKRKNLLFTWCFMIFALPFNCRTDISFVISLHSVVIHPFSTSVSFSCQYVGNLESLLSCMTTGIS